MSAKSPFPVNVVAILCSVVAWVLFVHLLSAEPLMVILVCPIVWSLVVWEIVFFSELILRDTIRRRGVFGINFKPIVCTKCGTPWVRMTKPTLREVIRGICTCHECGFEMNQWGRTYKEQNNLAKWSILRKAEDPNKRQNRAKHWEDRIQKFNEQTQRGDAS